jgi:hypothetical protein
VDAQSSCCVCPKGHEWTLEGDDQAPT